MTADQLDAINDEIERLDCILIAAEKWGKAYAKDPKTHTKIIRVEASMAKNIRKVFKQMAVELKHGSYIDWTAYYGLKADFKIESVVNNDFYDRLDNEFFKITFSDVVAGTTVGALAGENIYDKPLGLQSTDEFIQKLATDRLAYLVGKVVDNNGKVVDNPKADYRISDKTRDDINQAVKTSISLGEDKQETIDRLSFIVDNPARASTIAQTESVNAYGSGLLGYGKESGATGKEWQDVGAEDICGDNSDQGVIDIDDEFVSGDDAPAAHPGCRCSLRIVYQNEYDPSN